MSFLSDILGTIGNVASTVGQGVGNAASTVGQGIGSVFSSGKNAITQTSSPDAWQNVSYEAPPVTTPGTKVGWGDIAKSTGQSIFKNLKSSDMPFGMKGLATKQSGKYTPGLKGPSTPQGIHAVKGMEQESFKLDDATLKKLQAGLDERAKNRAAMAGYASEKNKYSNFIPTEGTSYEVPPGSPERTEEEWNTWLDKYYNNGYDQWSFMD